MHSMLVFRGIILYNVIRMYLYETMKKTTLEYATVTIIHDRCGMTKDVSSPL